MADINAGQHLRFENGGTITIAGDTLLNIVEGSLKWRSPGYETIEPMDRGVMLDPLEGNERPTEIELDVRLTSGSAADLIGALTGAGTAGVKKTATIVATIFDNRGATTGDSWTFASCYLPEGYEYSAASGADTDRLSLRFKAKDLEPAYAAVT